ncbi:helix-turn-helix domain-containing protein [Lichenibacterium ramalinae]|uniref:Helix-turn-helix domain-containing protein n=1 Tax=Lichenibacterium ramalinae TaxID=2316527 RepID=A0A4Q2RH16_9HYPH|nr:helix-turn-helix domain-containing protein [Lichenibacterium ramalinae]RYB05938.1 helix-turn-helix domain-containing protein [Lichenibacterium ramalinae]
MDIRPIRTDDDHRDTLVEIERLWAYPDDSPENDKLDVLATLVEVYEAQRWPRRDCTPAEILLHAVTEMGHSQAELAELLGSRPMASELVRAKRRISLAVAQKISAAWHIPIQLLVAPYALAA